jgi:hypothetical protein
LVAASESNQVVETVLEPVRIRILAARSDRSEVVDCQEDILEGCILLAGSSEVENFGEGNFGEDSTVVAEAAKLEGVGILGCFEDKADRFGRMLGILVGFGLVPGLAGRHRRKQRLGSWWSTESPAC